MEIPAISQIRGQTVLVAPLDWGMGHASRCVEIIQALKEKNRVLIGCSPAHQAYFKTNFPDVIQIQLPAYNTRYARSGPVWLSVVLQLPRLLKVVKQENSLLKQILTGQQIDMVISDNRYGLYHPGTSCVLITHQLCLKLPLLQGLLNRIHRRRMENFSEIWVPDYETQNKRLAGELSERNKIKVPVRYLGPLSALSLFRAESSSTHSELLLLLSGPEPQRSILENMLIKKFSGTEKQITLIRGSEQALNKVPASIRVINLVYGKELAGWIKGADKILCRSGYSTLMDLHVLGKENMVLVPTPGQPEQEYLAEYWAEKFKAQVCPQTKLKDLKI